MGITCKVLDSILEEKDMRDEQVTEEFFKLMPADPDRELVKQTCETFTRLLLSITPFKAKEFVERNCAKVRRKIMAEVNERTLKKLNGGNKDE